MRTRLVRNGVEEPIPERGEGGNTFFNVYTVMFWQIYREYSGLPDMYTIKASAIRFFYDGLRKELLKHKPE